jgi:hypothetical protein
MMSEQLGHRATSSPSNSSSLGNNVNRGKGNDGPFIVYLCDDEFISTRTGVSECASIFVEIKVFNLYFVVERGHYVCEEEWYERCIVSVDCYCEVVSDTAD